MKQHINKFFIGALSLALLGGGMTSCSESFLDENAGHLLSEDLLETSDGALAMAAGLYGNIRWHFGYEWAYGITLYGCDEFTNGADLTAEPWNTYDNRLQPLDCTTALGAANNNCPAVSALWDQMYYGISTANQVLARAEQVENATARNSALGEAHFLRGYNYYRLFAQYGGVMLQKEVADEFVTRGAVRASEEETLNFVIEEFEQAYNQLRADKWRGNGTWTKWTAAHFLAKALLFRQSERCASWNSKYDKKTDLDRVVALCNEVIAACPLAPDYASLYANWTGVNCDNEKLDEILMCAEHDGSTDKTVAGRFGNRTYNYFAPQFSNFSGSWVKRGQFIGEMDFQRCRPTEYTYAIFDNVNDARMWKTFKTIYGLNNIPVMKDSTGTDGKTYKVYNREKVAADNGIAVSAVPGVGDYGIVFILNKKNDARFQDETTYGTFDRGAKAHSFIHPETGKWVPNVFPVYLGGKYVLNTYGVSGNPSTSNVFCGINKCTDGSRTAEKGDAHRDVIMARTGETYLVKAEAQVRLGNYQDALTTINQLRARGQWKAGEDREAYVDGSIAFETNTTTGSNSSCVDEKNNRMTNRVVWENSHPWKSSYYLSTGIERTTAASSLQIASYTQLPEEDEAVLAQLGCTSDYDRMLNFVFNERTRELLGEWNRWEELSRAGLLIKRAKAFNPEAQGITANKNELRPVPQKFIDVLQNEDGTNLSDEQKKAWQNVGY